MDRIKPAAIFIAAAAAALVSGVTMLYFGSHGHGENNVGVYDRGGDIGQELRSFRYDTPYALMNYMGDRCEAAELRFEESSDVPAGNIIDARIISLEPGESGKIPVTLILSSGRGEADGKCDLKNLADDTAPYSGHTVSRNEFYTVCGRKMTADISIVESAADGFGNETCCGLHEVTILMNGTDKSYFTYTVEEETGGYECRERFSLLFEDYNADGSPDFCFRIGAPEKDGAYYRMALISPEKGEVSFRRHSSDEEIFVYNNEDIFVYGENANAIRLDIIDRDTYFFITKQNDEPTPVMYNKAVGYETWNERAVNHGAVFTSRYEDGVIYLKATEVTGNVFEGRAELSLKKLDNMVWEDVPFGEWYGKFYAEGFGSDCEEIAVTLSRGLYRLTADIDGVKTSTEFYSR